MRLKAGKYALGPKAGSQNKRRVESILRAMTNYVFFAIGKRVGGKCPKTF